MTKILYVARYIPFYREGILKRLSQICESRFVCQNQEFGVGETPKIEGLERLPLKCLFRKIEYFSLRPILGEYQPNIVICEFGLKFGSVFFLVFWKKVLGYKLVFWTHGLEGPRKLGRMLNSDYLRKWLMNRADAIMYYTQGCSEASHSLLTGPKQYVANNTLDSDRLSIVWEQVQNTTYSGSPYIVFIGRLTEAKRVLELIELAELLKRSGSSTEIRIAGRGPLENELREQVELRSLPITFLGAVVEEFKKANLLYHAVTVICIGGVGLNIVDAIAVGAPLLSIDLQSEVSAHGPEVSYLRNGQTGWLCKSLSEMAERVQMIENDTDLRQELRETARKFFLKECSIERQFLGFEEMLRDFSEGRL